MWTLDQTFEMNSKNYRTDAETLDVLRSVIPACRAAGEWGAVAVIMDLGIGSGRIVEA